MRARFVAGAGLIGLIAALGLAPAASADTTTIGLRQPRRDHLTSGAPSFAVIQRTTDRGLSVLCRSRRSPPVAAHGASRHGALWAGAGDGSASLEIWRPTGTPGEFRLIAIGPEQPFPTGVVTTHPVNIPVLPGRPSRRSSAARTRTSARATAVARSGDVWIWPHGSTTPAVGQTIGAPSSDFSRPQVPSATAAERSGDGDLDSRRRGDDPDDHDDYDQEEVQEEEAQALGGVRQEEVQEAQEEVGAAAILPPSWRSPRRDSPGRGATSGAPSTRSRPRG